MATKNDIAWEKLFHQHDILKYIEEYGFYEIESSTINKERESRLMAKFDQYINLPKLFKKNKLSILPISRSKYVIGKFDAYSKLNYDTQIENIPVTFPYDIESLDYSNLYSESSALHCAFLTGIIDQVAGEKMQYTVSGRMSTSSFDFNIRNVENNSRFPVSVQKSQLEIDAGFEGKNSFLIVEAKNYNIDDFLIRQIYYPYRLWQNKLSKKVVPVFFTYSNDRFSFFVYEFTDANEYNSLVLIKQQNFIIDPEIINLNEIVNLLKSTNIETEPEIPFPQADKFERIIDLLGLLVETPLTKDDITSNYQFDARQTDYYTNAAMYLDLVYKLKNNSTKEIVYGLTAEGSNIMKKRYKNKYMKIIEKIIIHDVFAKVLFHCINSGKKIDNETVRNIMKSSNLFNINKEGSTLNRRAQTVISWINWILQLTK